MKKHAKTDIPAMIYGMFGVILLVGVMSSYFVSADMEFIRSNVSETNRLLATFQRIDTVKGELPPCVVNGVIAPTGTTCKLKMSDTNESCAEGFILIDGQCIRTIGAAREQQDTASSSFKLFGCTTIPGGLDCLTGCKPGHNRIGDECVNPDHPQSEQKSCTKWTTDCHGMGLCDRTCAELESEGIE